MRFPSAPAFAIWMPYAPLPEMTLSWIQCEPLALIWMPRLFGIAAVWVALVLMTFPSAPPFAICVPGAPVPEIALCWIQCETLALIWMPPLFGIAAVWVALVPMTFPATSTPVALLAMLIPDGLFPNHVSLCP